MTRVDAFRAAFMNAIIARYRWRMNGRAPTPYRLHRDTRAVVMALVMHTREGYPLTSTEMR